MLAAQTADGSGWVGRLGAGTYLDKELKEIRLWGGHVPNCLTHHGASSAFRTTQIKTRSLLIKICFTTVTAEILIYKTESLCPAEEVIKPEFMKITQHLSKYWICLVFLTQGITMTSVPFAWMNMKREINSESCHVLMVSFLHQTSLHFQHGKMTVHVFDQEQWDVLICAFKVKCCLAVPFNI